MLFFNKIKQLLEVAAFLWIGVEKGRMEV